MKKRMVLFCALLLCVTLCVPVLAFANPPIVDGAGYLTAAEEEELSALAEAARQKHSTDIAIVTEWTLSGYDAQSTAEDLLDYGGYGGLHGAGILFYICAGERVYYITEYNTTLADYDIAYLQSCVEALLSKDDYYGAMRTFIEECALRLDVPTGEAVRDAKPKTKIDWMAVGAVALLPLLVAFVLMLVQLSRMRTAVKNDYAASYIQPGSQVMHKSQDVFLYSTVMKHAKPKPNSSGGGMHRTSVGRVHRGGGGRF